jgi:hypothetical protein
MSYDFATPGVGPMKTIGPPLGSVELEKYLNYNTSLRSKSDINLNPQPEGNVKMAVGGMPEDRAGVYAIQTDRGNLYPTIETQANVKGPEYFKNRLQDEVRPTTKDTLLHTYEGNMNSVVKNQTEYSQFLPTYVQVGDQVVRASGASNYGLRSATEYSYTPGAATTGLNNNVVQDPDVVINNLWKRPDNNVDGAGTFKGALPDSSRFQVYDRIKEPTTNGLRLNYNLEAADTEVLGQKLSGVEERFTSAYQIAPLMSNPLHKIWNPDDKGEIPAFYCNSNPGDFSYIHQTRLPEDSFVQGGYTPTWDSRSQKDSSNAYILSLGPGIHNDRIEFSKEVNNKPGTYYDSQSVNPGKCYSGTRSISDLYPMEEYVNSGQRGNIFTTLGDPTAGFINS